MYQTVAEAGSSEAVERVINGRLRQKRVSVERQVYDQSEFDAGYTPRPRRASRPLSHHASRLRERAACTPRRVRRLLFGFLPILDTIWTYDLRENLFSDVIAGLTVAIMHVPQGMAYGLLAGVKPVYGLYTSFFPVLIYAIFGTSNHISMGTFAVVSIMISEIVTKNLQSWSERSSQGQNLSTELPFISTTASFINSTVSQGTNSAFNDWQEQKKIEIATAAAFIIGALQLLMGLVRLGVVAQYLAEPLTRGFTTGAAVHVFTSQIKYVFGIEIARETGPFKLIRTYINFFRNIGSTKWMAIAISVPAILILYIFKEFINPKVKAKIKAPIPIELLLVIIGTLVSHFTKMNENWGIRIVGSINSGIEPPRFPPPDLFLDVIGDCIAVAIVGFAVSVSLAKLFAKKHNYSIDANQELVAYGIANLFGSSFNCVVSAASLSRSSVQEGVGCKTRVTSLVSCLLMLIVLLQIGQYFQALPNAILASIIIVALKGMFMQLLDLKKLWFISKFDFFIWLVTFLSTVIINVDLGLFIGVGFCLLTVVIRTQYPYTCTLGQVPHTDIYKDMKIYHSAEEVLNTKIFRFDSSLYYANVEYFLTQLYSKTKINPKKINIKQTKIEKKNKSIDKKIEKLSRQSNVSDQNVDKFELESLEESKLKMEPISTKFVILDCSTMAYIDYMGVSTLSYAINEFDKIGVKIFLAGCKGSVREILETAGFYEKIEKSSLYLTVHDAVLATQEQRKNKVDDHVRNDKLDDQVRNNKVDDQTFSSSIYVLPNDVNNARDKYEGSINKGFVAEGDATYL